MNKLLSFLLSSLKRCIMRLWIIIILAVSTTTSYIIAAVWIFFYLPDDYLQGSLVKIMYIHVPCAWISLSSYVLLGVFSIFYLIYNDRFCSMLSNAAIIVSLHTCLITLVTGAIWGKAAWGTWWVWDPRLTAVFIQFCLLLVCYMMREYAGDNSTVEQSTALLTIIGLINIPIIKFAVNAWNSIHQNASVFRLDGARIHPNLLYPLFLSFFAISCFYLLIGVLTVRNQITELQLRRYR
jgi:heme exporter protein C